MAPSVINILLTSFPGLGIPSTLCLPIPYDASVDDVTAAIAERLPRRLFQRLVLTTGSNQEIHSPSGKRISEFLSDSTTQTSLTLRLSAPLCGGKGGFGSQLRAAGGRMSSRKKRNQGDNNGSSRNLDGRRLRTVAEAKALAEYLAVKPEMERKEKEERRKRWEEVVEAAEAREEEIKSAKGKTKIDAKWLEEKEEAEQKMREAVLASMSRGQKMDDASDEIDNNSDVSSSSSSDIDGQESSSSKATTPPSTSGGQKAPLKVFGWDDDDDDDEEEDEEDDREEEKEEQE